MMHHLRHRPTISSESEVLIMSLCGIILDTNPITILNLHFGASIQPNILWVRTKVTHQIATICFVNDGEVADRQVTS